MSRILTSRKVKVIFTTVLLIVILYSSSICNNEYLNQFINTKDIFIPTTSHLQGVNLKKYSLNSNNHNLLTLRDQLSYTFPYNNDSPIPKIIWQTWKTGPSDSAFPSNFRNTQKKWNQRAQDQGYQYSLVTDDAALSLLENLYAECPLILHAYNLLPTVILKADFFRYLILFARGGIYSDMDTVPLKDLNEWGSISGSQMNNQLLEQKNSFIPYKNVDRDQVSHNNNNKKNSISPGLVIGIEADPDRDDWQKWYARRIQFCQWTMQAKPGHPLLRELIMNITSTTLHSVKGDSTFIDSKYLNDYNVNYRWLRGQNQTYNHSQLKNKKNVDGTDIMNWTGPGIFTDIAFEYFTNLIQSNKDILLLNPDLIKPASENDNDNSNKSIQRFYKKINEDLETSAKLPWEFFAFIKSPIVIDDVMVLPITAFSPGVGQMEARGVDDPMALVEHLFSGTWKESADKNAKESNNGGIPPVPA
ncbi:similar to Saccharomyces cerevisiae YGL038C OCH1 Mannosyltransferase of the cis-Golgi apparatus [Maudiozyma saulgeensis]|uniref:Similar to Saccharomyces cerevisiae YGL038C OCH1 Mannosyltransferase of the cis-Golgi apparatus n=1 Tax=Maudiozyma saulgeensis TaxID=1789683 RepID=A0A1X7RA68_9SACH|nr:similar to Saccharomyces cerevisiae YGL038C OCH1 Mannosyltransferase of the cis-Golgi apparatus [Kazachstania saulgeensis]